jgi:hypothetical protein
MFVVSTYNQRCVDELVATWLDRDKLRQVRIWQPEGISSPGLSRPATRFDTLILPSFD